MALEIVKMFGIKVHPLTLRETVSVVENEFILSHKPLHLMGVNADKINQCFSDNEMKKIVNSCDLVNADGSSVVFAAKFLGLNIPERVAGIDLMQELLILSEIKGYKVFFLGAKEEILLTMLNRFKKIYPNLNVVGYRNGYFSSENEYSVMEQIKESGAQIVFVGITSPKKEYLIEYFLANKINSVFMGVGGSFDVLSGYIKRAPKWMQNSHLEWLFRVIKEPRRLFKRYFFGNIQFILRVLKEKEVIE